MRLLLTRAPDDAARVRERLEADGHQVLVSPVIEMAPISANWPCGAFDAALATSAQAFLGSPGGLSPEARRLIPLMLVGHRTEEAARASGFLGAAHVAPTAAALAGEIAAIATRPRRLVYLAGRHRKADIELALDKVGQVFEVIEVYEARAVESMSPAVAAALNARDIDAVLHFSRRSAAIFLAQADRAHAHIASPLHLCISRDAAEPLRKAGLSTIKIARTPNVPALLDLLDTI